MESFEELKPRKFEEIILPPHLSAGSILHDQVVQPVEVTTPPPVELSEAEARPELSSDGQSLVEMLRNAEED